MSEQYFVIEMGEDGDTFLTICKNRQSLLSWLDCLGWKDLTYEEREKYLNSLIIDQVSYNQEMRNGEPFNYVTYSNNSWTFPKVCIIKGELVRLKEKKVVTVIDVE